LFATERYTKRTSCSLSISSAENQKGGVKFVTVTLVEFVTAYWLAFKNCHEKMALNLAKTKK